MLKQPLTHRLRKAFGNDSTNTKVSGLQNPQNPKNASPSLFGGLRTPFASLFSSFRKSKRQHAKPQQNKSQGPPRYDHFSAGTHTSSKVEEMATTETCESSSLPEPSSKDFDTGQGAMVEDSMCTWNEQLENELLRVLGSLDDQLAQEQSRDPAKRRTSSDYGSRAAEINQYSTINQPGYLAGVQRNERSMFLSEGTRTLRAKDEYNALFRRRTLYDTYIKRNQAENYTCRDGYGTPPGLRRRYSSRSLGHSSEGSLQHPSGPHGSGFEQKDFMPIDTVNRSYSLSSLSRRQSLTSVDQLARARPLHFLEGTQRITQRNYCCYSKRPPLSSIMWHTPQPSEYPLYSERILRTQSLMEFGPASEDTYPCFPQYNTRPSFYKSKVKYRRVGPNTSPFAFADRHADRLLYNDRENYFMQRQLERNISRCFYRYPSFHGRMRLSHRSPPSGRPEDHLWRPAGDQHYSNEAGLATDRRPTHQSHWQNVCVKKVSLQQGDHSAESHRSEYRRSVEYPESDQSLLSHAEGTHNYPVYGGSVPVGRTERALPRHNLFIGADPAASDTLIKHLPANTNFKTLDLNGVNRTDQSSEADGGSVREASQRLGFKQVDTANSTFSQWAPPRSCSAVDPQTSISVKPAHSLNSKGQTKSTSVGDTENINSLNSHPRSRQRKKGDCATSDFDQTTSSQLTANSTRASVCQSLPQEGSKTLENFKVDQESEKMNSSSLSRDPELSVDAKLLDSHPEKSDKCNRLVRHSVSNSITGLDNNRPPKSPVTDYTLAKKSASVDGSIMLKKPIISVPKEIPFKHRTTVEGNLETLESEGIGKKSSSRVAKIPLVGPAGSSLSLLPNKVTCKRDIMQSQGGHFLSGQDPNSCLCNTDSKGKEAAIDSQGKGEISLLSKSEETDSENPLKQYKTTSTFSVSIEEDNVQYRELISVYYTLPRKQSRTLCNLFGDDTNNADPSPLQVKNHTPQKKYKVRIGLATVAFPPSLQKKETANSSGQIAAIPSMPQDSKTSDEVNEEKSPILNPMVEGEGTSQSQCVKEKAAGSPKQASILTTDILPNNQKPSVARDESVNALSSVLSNLYIGSSSSLHQEGPEVDTLLNLSSSDSTDQKPSSETLTEASSVMEVHNECYHPLVASSDLRIPPSNLIADNQTGRHGGDLETSTAVKSTKEKATQVTEVKARERYSCHIIRLQSRGESFRNSTDKALTLETTADLHAQNQRLEANTDSTVNSKLQPNRSSLESSKSEPKVLHNPFPHNACTDSQRSIRNSLVDQNSEPPGQLTGTTQDPFDCSENKLMLDSTKDRTSDIEKRKNRPSIKNKLAAMYRTSRKFSSKKNSSPKPHLRTIFSQNDAPLETDSPQNLMTSPDSHQLLLEPENKNQNQEPLVDEFKGRQFDKSENKGTQSSEDPFVFPSEIRKPFTNLCNQKRENLNLKRNSKETESVQLSTAFLPKEIKSMLGSNSKACDEVENYHHGPISIAPSSQKKKYISNVADSLCLPLPSNNSNVYKKNNLEVNVCPQQKVTSSLVYDHSENIKQLKRLRNPSLPWVEAVISPSKPPRERHFSESSYPREPPADLTSGNNLNFSGKYSRKFKSYSELLSCDESENWEIDRESKRNLGSRRVLYPSIEFGIFGKEQQQAFLDNIKRSLTEGRLWRPCLLKNPRSMRKEEGCSIYRSDVLSSNLADRNMSAEGSSTHEQADTHGEGHTGSSDSDSDTTTDDEYYLTENDKESEL